LFVVAKFKRSLLIRQEDAKRAPEVYKCVYGQPLELVDNKIPLPPVVNQQVLFLRAPTGSLFPTVVMRRAVQIICAKGHNPGHAADIDPRNLKSYVELSREDQDFKLRSGNMEEQPQIQVSIDSDSDLFVNLRNCFTPKMYDKIQAAIKKLDEMGLTDFPLSVSHLLQVTADCLDRVLPDSSQSNCWRVNPFSLVDVSKLTKAQFKRFNDQERIMLEAAIRARVDEFGRITVQYVSVSNCTGAATKRLYSQQVALPGFAQFIKLKEEVQVEPTTGKVFRMSGEEIFGTDNGFSLNITLRAEAGFQMSLNKGRLVVSAVLPHYYPSTTVDHHAEYGQHPDYKNNSIFWVRDSLKAVNIKLQKAVKQHIDSKPSEQEKCGDSCGECT